jgi:hypothetical protein
MTLRFSNIFGGLFPVGASATLLITHVNVTVNSSLVGSVAMEVFNVE